ncbi:MAG: hypothetical protein AAB152_00295 [Candidatus Coatesbacteria bacterium]
MKTHALMLVGVAALALAGCGSKESVKATPEGTAPAPVAAPADAPVLAVSTVQGQSVNKAEAGLVTDMIRSELMALGRWRIIDRERMDEALKGQVLALAGVTSDSDAVHLGKLLNAKLIGLGTYGQLMGVNVVTFRIVDVETGLAINAGTAQGKDPAELRREIAKMVRSFSR